MEARKIMLLVENHHAFLNLFLSLPETQPFDFIATNSTETALSLLKTQPVDLIITDARMSDAGKRELFERAGSSVPEVPTIVVTARNFADSPVERQSRHCVTPPLAHQMALLRERVRDALSRREIPPEKPRRNRREAIPADPSDPRHRIIGRSDVVRTLVKQIQEVADLKVTVLIQGETGTGKELVARAIHEIGCRRGSPFFGISCAELSPGVLESELFGHERGSFTGAVALKKGLFEVVNKGTLFLDEISEAPAALQAKLLRVLETRVIKRLGGVTAIPTDFRVIAATNRDLQKEVDRGGFRSDLLYRLNVYTITVPPLRERRDDIALIADYYLDRFTKTYHKPLKGFTEGALMSMRLYKWPGNVRELVNVVERAVITAEEGRITTANLPFQEARQVGTEDLTLRKMEKVQIIRALAITGGHQGRAAQQLGMARKTLIEKLKKYDIGVSDYA